MVEVLIDCAYRDIVADRLDAGIRLGEKLEQDMIALKWARISEWRLSPRPTASPSCEAIRHLRDLIAHRCINDCMVGAGTIYVWEFGWDGQALDVRATGPLTFNGPALMLDAALGGLGVGYLPHHKVAAHLASGRFVRLLADWTPPFPTFHLYYTTRRQMRPVLGAFINAMRGQR